MSENHSFYLIQDGGPIHMRGCEVASHGPKCDGLAVGNFLVIDDDTGEQVASIDLCDAHAKKLATGYA